MSSSVPDKIHELAWQYIESKIPQKRLELWYEMIALSDIVEAEIAVQQAKKTRKMIGIEEVKIQHPMWEFK